MACVNVCPQGIDIRNGQQMECITCGLCIDACDDVMAKIGKPRGLIDYYTLKDEQVERAGGTAKHIWRHILRPRTILYTSLWSLVGFGLVFALFIRPEIDMTVAPVRNPTYVTLSDGTIRNAYDIRLRNKHGEARLFGMSLANGVPLVMEIEGAVGNIVTVPADEMSQVRVYLSATPDSEAAAEARTELRLWITDLASGERSYTDTIFNGRDDEGGED